MGFPLIKAENRLLRDRLTVRECEIVSLVTKGLRTDEIAIRLLLSPHTVHTHLRRAYKKVGVRNRTSMAALWLATDDYKISTTRVGADTERDTLFWKTSRLCSCPHCGGELVVIRNLACVPSLAIRQSKSPLASRKTPRLADARTTAL